MWRRADAESAWREARALPRLLNRPARPRVGYTDSILAEYQGMPLMPKPFTGPALKQAVRDVLDERPAGQHAPPV